MNSQNDILTAVRVLIQSGMHKEAIELINASMAPKTLFTQTILRQKCIVCGDPNGHGGLTCPSFSSKSSINITR